MTEKIHKKLSILLSTMLKVYQESHNEKILEMATELAAILVEAAEEQNSDIPQKIVLPYIGL